MSSTGASDSSMRLPNANAGGHPGATLFASTCGCSFYQTAYPYAIGPRSASPIRSTPRRYFAADGELRYQFVANAAGSTIGTQRSLYLCANSPSYIPTVRSS